MLTKQADRENIGGICTLNVERNSLLISGCPDISTGRSVLRWELSDDLSFSDKKWFLVAYR